MRLVGYTGRGRHLPSRGSGRCHGRWRPVALVVLALLACLGVIVASSPVAPAVAGTTASLTSARLVAGGTGSGALESASTVVDGSVTVSVDALAPEVLSGDEDMTVSLTLANGTDAPVGGTVVVQLQRSTDVTIAALGSWLAGERNGYLRTVATSALDEPLSPGEVRHLEVQVDHSRLPLTDADQWGPRGVQVLMVSGNDTLARARTLAVWDAGRTVDPTRMTVVVPVVATPAELAALARLAGSDAAASSAPDAPGVAPGDGETSGSTGTPTPSASPSPAGAAPSSPGADPGTSTQPTAVASTDAGPGTSAGATEEESDTDVVASLTARVTRMLELSRAGVLLAVDPSLLSALGIQPLTRTTTEGAAGTAPAASPTPTPAATGTPSTPADSDDAPHSAQDESAPDPAGTDKDADTGTGTDTDADAGAGSEATAPPTLSVPQARLVRALRAAVGAGRVITLLWQDADVSALAALDTAGADVLATAWSRTTTAVRNQTDAPGGATTCDRLWDPASPAPTASASPTTASGDTTGPAGRTSSCDPAALTDTFVATGPLDQRTLATLPASVTTIITQPWDLPVTESLTYTPSGTTSLSDRTVIVPDPQLSGTLAGRLPTINDPTAAPQSATSSLTPLTTRQLLRAETAILTRQAPNMGRDVVVSIDRATLATLTVDTLDEQLDALLDTSWTQPQDLAGLRAHADDDAASARSATRAELPAEASQHGGISASELDDAVAASTTLSSVASIVPDPAALVGDPTDHLLAATATSWRTDPAGRLALVATTGELASSATSGLAVLTSSTINVIAASADLPVRLSSSLDQDATVTIHLDPSSVRLQADNDVTVTVPAHEEKTITVPVRAVGSGDVEVTVSLHADDGTAVGTPITLHTRVRADWESVGTRTAAGVLALLLAAGIWRTVRRGRRLEPETLPDQPTEDANPADPANPATDPANPADPATDPAEPEEPIHP